MKVSEMFPARFMRGQDLSAPILVQLTAIEREEVHPRPGVSEQKYVLRFERIDPRSAKPAPMPNVARAHNGYGVILRKSLAQQIAAALGTDETDEWVGKRIVLESSQTRAAGHDVLTVAARAPKTKPATEPPPPSEPLATSAQTAS
jgi:hypothetical protein